ncbi:hypothetical protein BDR22DRAFT_818129 [Usnea florida]
MKLSMALPSLSPWLFLLSLSHAAPQTRYSTITVIPVPLLSTVTHYHPTGSPYGSGSDKSGMYTAYHNASANISLSYTLSYPTTKLQPTSLFARPSKPSNATMTDGFGDLSLPRQPRPCTPSELYCNSKTSFSVCASAVGGGSRYVFMGTVAKGTSCDDRRIVKAHGGNCTPVGNLKCNGERGFFLCKEGGLVNMGDVIKETTCADGEIEIVTSGR